MISLLLLVGCASHVPRFPGPLGPVASTPPAAHVHSLPRVVEAEPPPPRPRPVRAAPKPAPAPKAPPKPAQAEPKPSKSASKVGKRAADAARHYLDHRPPSNFRNDCSGFVMAVYDRAGMPIAGNSRSLWADAGVEGRIHRKKRPAPGDVAFFDNTYDRNRNGRRDDVLTHVAVVISVDDDGTITLGHAGTSKGRTTLRMNLEHPSVRADASGKVLNDYLRARKSGESRNNGFLAGELFKGFSRVAP